jgi:hypothetical protein
MDQLTRDCGNRRGEREDEEEEGKAEVRGREIDGCGKKKNRKHDVFV